jgi:tetratricopeptide (TPR) repeat protein
MSEAVSNSMDKDLRLTQVLDAYLAGLPQGATPDPDELLARHPDLADDLRECLDCLAFIRQAARPAEGDGPQGDAAGQEPAPRELGDFRIVREVGKGGMGVVYEAEQLSLGRRVALKVLPFAATLDARQLQRFKNEAQAAAGLHHTNIVPVHFVGCERGVHFYAMQYIDGQTLAQVIAELRRLAGRGEGGSEASPVLSAAAEALVRGQTMPEPYPANGQEPTIAAPSPRRTDFQSVPPGPAGPETAVQTATSLGRSLRSLAYFEAVARLGVQASEALEHAHQLGVVHRDVKPGNLLLDGRSNLWITDFGLAHCQSQAGLTMTGDLVGTLRYMSPEQALAKRVAVDHRTDVYSLGATLYELLTLEPAFAGSDREELLRQVAFEDPKPPRRHNKAIPADLETIVLKALAKNPAERYATAQEVADDLRRFLEHKPIQARRPTLVKRLRKWARRHRAAVWSAAVVLLVAVVLGAGEWVRVAQQQAAAEHEVELALQEVRLFQEKGNWPEALAAVRRAAGLVAGGRVGEELARRVRKQQADMEMAVKLEEIPLRQTALRGHESDTYERADRAYQRAFEDYGIDLARRGPRAAAELIRASRIRAQLTEALDDWALACRRKQGKGGSAWKDLLTAARAADPDAWRNRLRDAVERSDARALKRLAVSKRAGQLPPPTLALLGRALREAGAGEQAVPLLLAAQRRRPGDLWVNYELAMNLGHGTPPRWEEVVRFCTAALALRPKSPGLHVLLGYAFARRGNGDEALAAFRKAIDLEPGNAGIYSNLGLVLQGKGALREAIAAHKEAIRIAPGFAVFHYNLGVTLHAQGALDPAIDAYRKAVRLQPNYPVAHYNLALALSAKGRPKESIAAYGEAIRYKPNYASAHCNLGNLLFETGRPDDAIAAFRRAIRYQPGFGMAHSNLGNVFLEQGQLDKAIKAFRQAIRCWPRYALAHSNLGSALNAKGRTDEAIAACKTAIRLQPGLVDAHVNLASAFLKKNALDEAIEACRTAIRINRGNALAHYNLAIALHRKGELEAAIGAYRQAGRLQPDATTYFSLAAALQQKGALEKAIDACNQALHLKPDCAEAYCNLGQVLEKQGRFAPALRAYRRAHELGSRDPRWPYPTSSWIRQCGRLIAVESKLQAVLRGEKLSLTASERMDLADLCLRKGLTATAARFFNEAFAADPKLAGGRRLGPRYNAACAAALASCGQGKDAGGLNEMERARLRHQALRWVVTELAAWDQLLKKGSEKTRAVVVAQMRDWQRDPDLAGVRGKEALAKLPEAERPAWQKLWTDVADTLARAEAKVPPRPKN